MHAFLPAELHEAAQVRKIGELLFVDCGLCADGERVAYLGDNYADFARRNLHPWVLFDGIYHERFPTKPGHQQVGLIASFPAEGNRIVLRQLFEGEPFGDQADFGRSDLVK